MSYGRDDDWLWQMILGGLALVVLMIGFAWWNSYQTDSCTRTCAPNESWLKARYQDPNDCYCKIGGDWKLQKDW